MISTCCNNAILQQNHAICNYIDTIDRYVHGSTNIQRQFDVIYSTLLYSKLYLPVYFPTLLHSKLYLSVVFPTLFYSKLYLPVYFTTFFHSKLYLPRPAHKTHQ